MSFDMVSMENVTVTMEESREEEKEAAGFDEADAQWESSDVKKKLVFRLYDNKISAADDNLFPYSLKIFLK